jgi:hypothetical protein
MNVHHGQEKLEMVEGAPLGRVHIIPHRSTCLAFSLLPELPCELVSDRGDLRLKM